MTNLERKGKGAGKTTPKGVNGAQTTPKEDAVPKGLPKDSVDVNLWLESQGLASPNDDAKEKEKNLRWIKRNLKGVALISPKRGIYFASQKALDQAYADHNAGLGGNVDYKKAASKRLQVVNSVRTAHNKALKAEGKPILKTAEERQEYYNSDEGILALRNAYQAAGLAFKMPKAEAKKPKKAEPEKTEG